jgi:phosphopantetheine--protein transferase-like protein
MIFGIGIDVLQAQRMKDSYARFGTHLLDRLLLPEERVQFARTRRPDRFLAMHFAAKEAIVKAMGTGFAHGHVTLTDEAGLVVAVAVLMRQTRRPRKRRAARPTKPRTKRARA